MSKISDSTKNLNLLKTMLDKSYLVVGHRLIRKRHLLSNLILTITIIQLVRSLIYFIARFKGSKLTLTIIGDYLLILETSGDIIHFWVAAYSLLTIILGVAVREAEKLDILDLFNDKNNLLIDSYLEN